MFKQLVKLEVKKDTRDYILILPENCNLGEIVDVLFEMRTLTMKALQEIISKEKPPEDPKPEEPKNPE
jgi:hypothetical protein